MIVNIHDKKFETYISDVQIAEAVNRISNQIDQDYAGKRPLFLVVLNGSFLFAADLFRKLQVEAEICFIKLASYQGMKSSGKVTTAIGLDTPVKDRDVVLIEDIIDTGKTMYEFIPELMERQPASLKIASLLLKPDALKYDVKADYVGFSVPNDFLVGYGLDYDGLGRNYGEILKLMS
ncbi:MAG: hypoxanthine phosphoribosyltransferase [Bacteroidota bacterium]